MLRPWHPKRDSLKRGPNLSKTKSIKWTKINWLVLSSLSGRWIDITYQSCWLHVNASKQTSLIPPCPYGIVSNCKSCVAATYRTDQHWSYRSHLSRHKVKDIIAAKMGSKNPKEISDEMAIVVGSLAKLFCGELIGAGKGLFCFICVHSHFKLFNFSNYN